MPEPIKIYIRVPENIGLTANQIAALKEKVRVEIVTSTLPVGGITVKNPQQVVIQIVNGPNNF